VTITTESSINACNHAPKKVGHYQIIKKIVLNRIKTCLLV